jgi:hypothetical protein
MDDFLYALNNGNSKIRMIIFTVDTLQLNENTKT